jgi:hypothetical protein
MKVTIASLKETEEYLKNEPFRIVTPRRSRKYIEAQRKNKAGETASQKEESSKTKNKI